MLRKLLTSYILWQKLINPTSTVFETDWCSYDIMQLASIEIQSLNCRRRISYFMEEEFEDTKGEIRIRTSKKNRQHNGQKKKYKRTNNDLQNIHMAPVVFIELQTRW